MKLSRIIIQITLSKTGLNPCVKYHANKVAKNQTNQSNQPQILGLVY